MRHTVYFNNVSSEIKKRELNVRNNLNLGYRYAGVLPIGPSKPLQIGKRLSHKLLNCATTTVVRYISKTGL